MTSSLRQFTIEQLVDRFAENGVAQSKAEIRGQISKYNRLFGEMAQISDELRARGVEARLGLRKLYAHPNIHVRLQAAKCSYGAAPSEARKVLEQIRDFGPFPAAGDAGMSISALDDGTSMLD